MTYKEKVGVEIAGIGLHAISSLFGVDGSPTSNQLAHLELGSIMFGEGNATIQPLLQKLQSKHTEREKFTNNPELLIAKLKEMYTPEKWVKMTRREKKGFKITGIGLYAIASVFGVEGNPADSQLLHLELGLKIFGENNAVILPQWNKLLSEQAEREKLKNNPELLAETIKESFTSEKWAKMANKEKQCFKIAGFGLKAIASVFGVDGNPANNNLVHLELGLKIFGENNAVILPQLKKLQSELAEQEKFKNNPELLAETIKGLCSPEKWAKMPKKERFRFKIAGLGLAAIARIFGVDGKPTSNKLANLDLGLKIYGEDNSVILPLWKKLQSELAEQEKFKNNPELLAETIKGSHTPEKWVKMTCKEKNRFKIAGLGLVTISSKFGIDGSPACNQLVHLELGLKIYGKDNNTIRTALDKHYP